MYILKIKNKDGTITELSLTGKEMISFEYQDEEHKAVDCFETDIDELSDLYISSGFGTCG